jgi:hypothetical protein
MGIARKDGKQPFPEAEEVSDDNRSSLHYPSIAQPILRSVPIRSDADAGGEE